jgi:UDP-glucose 4-epimerase
MTNRKNQLATLHASKVLITGASGFVGTHLTNALIGMGVQVCGLSRRVPVSQVGIQYVSANIIDKDIINNIISDLRPTHIFHLAASKERGNEVAGFRRSYETNLLGTLSLLEACVRLEPSPKIISLGTCEEYGQISGPYYENMREISVSNYSCSKVAVTNMIQSFFLGHGLSAVVLRPSLTYGPGQGNEMFLPLLIRSLMGGLSFPMTAGEQMRDYIHVQDLVQAMILASVNSEANGQIFNISSAIPIRLIDLANSVADMISPSCRELIEIGKLPYRGGESMNYWADNKKAKDILSWNPKVTLEDGLKETVEYYRRECMG